MGWLSIDIAKNSECEVTGITLSENQFHTQIIKPRN